tara:strand:- start:138 stop:332 length:195 start_codon:yes stop_codon:yes gene_type:complete
MELSLLGSRILRAGESMKVGDLAKHKKVPKCWGIILAECMSQYEIYWMDGDRTWIAKRWMIKKI